MFKIVYACLLYIHAFSQYMSDTAINPYFIPSLFSHFGTIFFVITKQVFLYIVFV